MQYDNSTKVLILMGIFFVRFCHTTPVTDNQFGSPLRRQDVRKEMDNNNNYNNSTNNSENCKNSNQNQNNQNNNQNKNNNQNNQNQNKNNQNKNF